MDDLIIYIGLNIAITPMIDDEDKKKGEIYFYGIPIYAANSYLYTFIEKLKFLPYQEYIFKIGFQTFIDSLLYDSFSPVIIDGLLAASAITAKNAIN
jgi:hypothetical protein